jgi:hypothetical protein
MFITYRVDSNIIFSSPEILAKKLNSRILIFCLCNLFVIIWCVK